jgi:hypothetical protein
MFGYVRPLKPELLVREFARYRSVYCGLCKQIGHDYGLLPRLSTGYDLTLLAILLLSLSDGLPPERAEGCILNPIAKKPVSRGGPVLELCAGLSVLLAWHKAADNFQDGRSLSGMAGMGAFGLARIKARRRFPEFDRVIADQMAELAKIESGDPDMSAADVFGCMLQRIFGLAAGLVTGRDDLKQAIGLLGRDLGSWIYLIDAIDDLADDCNNGDWNPFSRLEPGQACKIAESALEERELAADRTAALLPYLRDGGLMANVFTKGLPTVRGQVLRGEKPARL